MKRETLWAGIALASLAALAGRAVAQPAAPVIGRVIAVRTVPVNPTPDGAESEDAGSDGADAGLEAREAMGPGGAAPASTTGTLNAQYAAQYAAQYPAQYAPLSPAQMAAPMPAAAEAAPAPAPRADPAGPSVALARRVVESAAAFAGYMQRAGGLQPDYADADGVSRALTAGGVYEAGQLEEGAVAYVALAALQDRDFVQAVSEAGRDPGARPILAARLSAEPRLVLQTPGAGPAAARAAAALNRLGLALYRSGAAVKQSAYDMQHSAWSRTAVVAPEQTLARIKAGSAVRQALGADGGQPMLVALTQLRGVAGEGGSGRLTPVVARGLTLAALAVLGEAGEEQGETVAALLVEDASAQCLKMARLNLYQCLSVAGPNYEDVFCLGQHAMMETARCVADASGWTPAAAAQSIAVPVARPASILVPAALTVQPSPATATELKVASAGGR